MIVANSECRDRLLVPEPADAARIIKAFASRLKGPQTAGFDP